MSSLYWPYLIADYYRGLEVVTAVVGVIILLSSLDDLFIDGWYWVRELWRSLTIKRRYTPLTAAQLRAKEEQPLAIMVPAWLEISDRRWRQEGVSRTILRMWSLRALYRVGIPPGILARAYSSNPR